MNDQPINNSVGPGRELKPIVIKDAETFLKIGIDPQLVEGYLRECSTDVRLTTPEKSDPRGGSVERGK